MQRVASVWTRSVEHALGVPGAAALGALLAVLAWQRAGLAPVESLEPLPGWAALVPLRAPVLSETPPVHAAFFAVVADPAEALLALPGNMRCGQAEMGEYLAEAGGRYNVQGPPDNVDPHLARPVPGRGYPTAHGAVVDGIGMPQTAAGSAGPTAPWGRDAALGPDPRDARGDMWGDWPGEGEGENGLGLAGVQGGVVKRFDVAPTALSAAAEIRVVHTGLRVTGARKPSEVGRVMASHFTEFQACAQSVPNGAVPAQRVSLSFEVAKDGHVAATTASAGALEQCLDQRLSQVTFTAGASDVSHVEYPLYFAAADRELKSPGIAAVQPPKPCDCGG
jgi:hypothetical protein